MTVVVEQGGYLGARIAKDIPASSAVVILNDEESAMVSR